MKTVHSILILLTVVIISACSSGKSAYKHGDYYSAVVQAVERLRKNPDHKKSSEILRNSYPMAVRYYTLQIENVQNSSERFRNGLMYDYYRNLNGLYENILRCPGALRVIPNPQNYTREAEQYRKAAAAERYDAGLASLAMGTRIDAIDAYYHFIKADEYESGYKDVENKIPEAREFATLKIMVEQLPVPTMQYQLSVEFFQEQVDQLLFNYQGNPFIRFYSNQDRNLRNPDQILEIRFDEFVVGETHSFTESKEITRDSVVVGQVTLDDGKKRDVLGSVKATFVENRQEIISTGLLTVRALDPHTERILLHEKLPGEFVWVSRWATFKGDERALNDKQLQLTQLKPIAPPPPQTLFMEFCRPIYSQLQSKIQGYYGNL